MTKQFALTLAFDEIVEAIYSSIAIMDDVQADATFIWVKALWDTGATHTCVSDRLAAQMGLQVVDIVHIATANGIVRVPTYFAQVKLSNGLLISDLELAQFQFSNDECDLIVGMDIITRGDFSITNVDGKTVFSFRVPTLGTIDYEAELNKEI